MYLHGTLLSPLNPNHLPTPVITICTPAYILNLTECACTYFIVLYYYGTSNLLVEFILVLEDLSHHKLHCFVEINFTILERSA